MLANKGIILVNSAGNSGMGPWKKITFPADAENTLTVGALNQQGVNAPFSGVGPTQDMRIKPDVMALGSPASLIRSLRLSSQVLWPVCGKPCPIRRPCRLWTLFARTAVITRSPIMCMAMALRTSGERI